MWMTTMLQATPPGVVLHIVSTARELGLTLNYNKVNSRATQRIRHQDSLQYMHRARLNHLTIDTRERICAFAMTKALWGTETYVVGAPWLKELRTTAAKTLVLNKGNSNPYLACTMLSRHLCDPVVHLLKTSIRSVRTWLQFAAASVTKCF